VNIEIFLKRCFIVCGLAISLSLPGLINAAAGKYIIVHAWNPGPDNPYYFKNCSTEWMKPMLDAIGKRGDSNIRLGFSDVIYALNTDDATIRSCLDKFFNASEQYDVPFLLQLDTERFWDSRPDLWNWFDPAKSGYNPANKNNVEWSGWNAATKESFINWGSPIKLAPKPCYESAAVKQVIANKFEIIASKLNAWRQKLSDAGKEYLFAGIDVAWETGIDDYRNASWLAAEYKYQLGYNALSKRGFSATKPPANINAELEKTVKDFNEYRAKFFYDKGISKDKIYTHAWGVEDQSIAGSAGYVQHGPISTGINNYSTLGVTLYPPTYDANRVKAAIGSAPWALIESPPDAILTAPANYLSLKDWLNYGNCKMAVVLGLSVSRADTASQIKQIASLIPANNEPIGYFDGADCNNASGWVCDSSYYTQPLKVNLYADGLQGKGVLIGTMVANVARESAVANLCGGNVNHGFIFPIPQSLKDGKTHTIYIYGTNIPSGNNPLLIRSDGETNPVTIKCGIPQVCVPNAVNGCKVCKADGSVWADSDSKCAVGKKCNNGVCAAACASTCTTANAKQCSGNGVQTCAMSGGCLKWSAAVACGTGKTCNSGECKAACVPKTCIVLGNYQCGNWSNGCGTVMNCGACATGKACSNGKCVTNCISHASKKCASGKLYWYNSCNAKEGLAQDCGSDMVTDNYRCSGNWTQRQTITKGCSNNACTSAPTWNNNTDCTASNKLCSKGVCAVTCTNECISGVKQCDSTIGFKTCALANGCLEWGVTANCPTGQVCSGAGVCAAPACVAKTCSALGNYQCGSWDDGCGNTLNCGTCSTNQTCQSGVCVTQSSGGGNSGGGGGGGTTNPPVAAKPVNQMTRAEIIAKVNEIMALIARLQEQLKAMTGGTTTAAQKYSCVQITNNLYYGMKNDSEVKCLQEVLKAQGFAVVATGDYGGITKTAVKQFQQRYAAEILTPYGLRAASGNVGNATMGKINALINAK